MILTENILVEKILMKKILMKEIKYRLCLFLYLKVVSTTFFLVCFVYFKESTCETKKNVFYFTLKAPFVLEIIKFKLFGYSNVIKSSNALE